MFNIALTGGIASGKTTVSNLFAQLGVNIIDTDVISRDLVKPGQAALHKIVQTFGQQVLQDNGALNRATMRQIIFANPAARKQLEAILHPLIRQQAWQQAANANNCYNMLVVPLLYEHYRHYPADRVLLIDISSELQKSRLKERDQLSDSEIEQALDSQSSREQRLSIADDVIENTGSPEDLCLKVTKLHTQYQQLANVPLLNQPYP